LSTTHSKRVCVAPDRKIGTMPPGGGEKEKVGVICILQDVILKIK
jgi:hypothetical protein